MDPKSGNGRAAVLIGRSLAACVHPYAAWRVSPSSSRLLILSAYVILGYLTVLSVLLILSPARATI